MRGVRLPGREQEKKKRGRAGAALGDGRKEGREIKVRGGGRVDASAVGSWRELCFYLLTLDVYSLVLLQLPADLPLILPLLINISHADPAATTYRLHTCNIHLLASLSSSPSQMPHSRYPASHSYCSYNTHHAHCTYKAILLLQLSQQPQALKTNTQQKMEPEFHINQRLSFTPGQAYTAARCTVRYSGPVDGTTGTWLGVEWDVEGKGKHSGVHGGKKYFECPSPPKPFRVLVHDSPTKPTNQLTNRDATNRQSTRQRILHPHDPPAGRYTKLPRGPAAQIHDGRRPAGRTCGAVAHGQQGV